MGLGAFAVASLFAGASAAFASDVSASQVMGAGNATMLETGLGRLGGTLNTLNTRLAVGSPPADSAGVNDSLNAIRSSLIEISSGIALLDNNPSGNVALGNNTSPGVPNTGAGGSAAANFAILGLSALAIVTGVGYLVRKRQA